MTLTDALTSCRSNSVSSQASWPQRRAAGHFGDPACDASASEVTLHIYDVAGMASAQKLNGVFRAFGMGVFHAGVEVFNQEWSFGSADNEDGSGVFNCVPRSCEAHVYREAVPMGRTTLTESQVYSLLSVLAGEWPALDYDVLRHNCCHFSDELCRRLGVGPMPAWVRNLASAGAALDDTRLAAASGVSDVLRRTIMSRKGPLQSHLSDLSQDEACGSAVCKRVAKHVRSGLLRNLAS